MLGGVYAPGCGRYKRPEHRRAPRFVVVLGREREREKEKLWCTLVTLTYDPPHKLIRVRLSRCCFWHCLVLPLHSSHCTNWQCQ